MGVDKVVKIKTSDLKELINSIKEKGLENSEALSVKLTDTAFNLVKRKIVEAGEQFPDEEIADSKAYQTTIAELCAAYVEGMQAAWPTQLAN